MKIGIVGNSHLAALKFARKDGCFSEHEIDFWGAPGSAFAQNVSIDGSRLLYQSNLASPQAPGLRGMPGVFDARLYDAVVIYAYSMGVPAIAHDISRLSNKRYSFNFRQEAVHELLHGRFSFKYARSIDTTKTKLIIYAAPFMSAEAPGRDIDIEPAVEILKEEAAILGATFAIQPEKTRENFSRTSPGYLEGIVHEDGKIRGKDFKHMNAQYGSIILDHIIRMLR